MAKPLEESEFATELRQLLAAVVLGDATDAQISRLNELLLRDKELRHHAARFLEEEAVLRREFEVLDRVVEFHNPLARDGCAESTLSTAATVACETRFHRIRRQIPVLAVAVLISAVAGVLWLERRAGTSAANQSANEAKLRVPPLAQSVDGASLQHPMLPLTASILTPVTRVSWSGPRFASELNNEPLASTMREGVTSFTSAFGRPAQGYMVCLRPGAFLDLVVAADSDGENALAVIEFDGAGRPTGRRLSYSNSAGEDDPDPAGAGKFSTLTKKGRLGIWTERNDSASPRYYFFTGVHKLLNRAADDSWHVSRLSAFVDEPDLFHIGWDDSGMPPGGDKDQSQIPDDDFDDVNATVRIRKLKPEPSERATGVHIYSKTAAYDADPNASSVSETDKYPFTVAAGQVAIVKVCSRSRAPIEIAVFEKGSDKLRWHCRQEKAHSPTLGICAIENNTLQPQEFYLVGQKKPPNAQARSSPHPLLHSVLFEKESLVTVGFDDVKKVSDFNTVRVDILTMDEL